MKPNRVAAFALAWSMSGALLAQEVFSSATHLVVLHISVKDRSGAFVRGLGRNAFTVFDDNRPQEIALFGEEDSPVTAGLLIDNSISMLPNRLLVIAGAETFIRASHPDDESFALVFNEHVESALPPSLPFTNDPAVLRDAIDVAVTARGKTALFDAVTSGLAYAAGGRHPRKVLVAISDGGDNASTATFEDVLLQTQASNAVIYTVVLRDPEDPTANPKVMKRLAETSGGQMFEPKDAREVSTVLAQVAADIRHAYTVGYVPTTPPDGRFHRLRVAVSSPAKQRLVVRTRAGYLAAPPSVESGHAVN